MKNYLAVILLSIYASVSSAGVVIPYPLEFNYLSAKYWGGKDKQHTLFLAKKIYQQLHSGIATYNVSDWALRHRATHRLKEIEMPRPEDDKDIAKFHGDRYKSTYVKKLRSRGYELVLWTELNWNWESVINRCQYECYVRGKVVYLDRYRNNGSQSITLKYRKKTRYFTPESLKKFDQAVADLLMQQQNRYK